MPPVDAALVASELRGVLGQLIRRLRTENRLPLTQGAVLSRLDREGPRSVSELAVAERVRPQSMAQTVGDLERDGLVARTPDPSDKRRAVVGMTADGRATLETDRVHREGWLAQTIVEQLSPDEQADLMEAVAVLRRLAES
ncbi:MAG TPA: MarR family transcriptional regulator [Solirubrobacteraceae bacterium]